ncbi:MAG: hypothetical protein ACOX5M_06395 [Bacillota bacterium]
MSDGRYVPLAVDGSRVVDKALQYVARRLGLKDTGAALGKVREGDLEAYLYFRYALAKEAVRDISAIAGSVDRALLFLENRCEEFPGEPVRVGLIVDRKTAAMQSLAEAVSETVSREAAGRIPGLHAFDGLLSIEILDAEALKTGSGLAAMVSSLYEPPIEVWPEA